MWTLEMWNFLFKDSTWKCSFWRFFVKMWVGSQMWTLADWNFLSKNSTRKWKKPSIYILRLVHSIPGLYIIHLYSYTYTYAYTGIVFEFGMLGSNFEGHKPIWHVRCFFLKVQVPNVRKTLYTRKCSFWTCFIKFVGWGQGIKMGSPLQYVVPGIQHILLKLWVGPQRLVSCGF